MNSQDFHLCGFQNHEGRRCPRADVEFTLIPWLEGSGAYLCQTHQLLFVALPTPWKVYLEEGGRYIENVGVQVHP